MSDIQDVVKTREIQLVDGEGKARIRLGLDDSDNATMQFLDSHEIVRVKVGCETKGPASIALSDSDGEARVVAMVAENGSSYLFMYDKQGVTRVQVETGSADITTVILGGKNKKPLLKATVDSTEDAYEQGSVSLYDSNGNLLSKMPQSF